MIDIQIILMVIQVLLTAVISGSLLLFTAANFLLPRYIIEIIDIEDFDSGEGWKATLLIKNVGWGKGQINEFIGASKVLSEGGWSEDSSIRITKNQVPPVHLMPKFLSGNSTEDYDEDITDVTVTIAAAELTEWESDISANTGVVFTAVIENETSVEDFSVPGISAYPNPVIGQLILVADSPIEGVDVFNMLGEKTASYKDLNSSSVTLDASPWKSGVYFLDISDIDGNRSLLKVVK